jgi:hypothetical protein
MTFSVPTYYSRARMLDFLGEVSARDAENAGTVYLPTAVSLETAVCMLEGRAGPELRDGLAEMVHNSKTGTVLFSGPGLGCLVIPPLPLREQAELTGYHVAPLVKLLETDFTIAVVLVRLGFYAVGLCQGESVLSSKSGTGLVHARHKKGGSSQGRFQRHREKQIEAFLGRVCGHIREHLEPEERSINYLAYGGAHTTILSLQKRCPFLGKFDGRLLPPLLDTPEPHSSTLQAAIKRVWSSRVFFWRGETGMQEDQR